MLGGRRKKRKMFDDKDCLDIVVSLGLLATSTLGLLLIAIAAILT